MKKECVKCVHFEMCNLSPSGCKFFKDKDRFYEAPCAVGDKAWFIKNGDQIIETAVEKIIIKSKGMYIKLECNVMYETSCNSIGKTVFFDENDARVALGRLPK